MQHIKCRKTYLHAFSSYFRNNIDVRSTEYDIYKALPKQVNLKIVLRMIVFKNVGKLTSLLYGVIISWHSVLTNVFHYVFNYEQAVQCNFNSILYIKTSKIKFIFNLATSGAIYERIRVTIRTHCKAPSIGGTTYRAGRTACGSNIRSSGVMSSVNRGGRHFRSLRFEPNHIPR